MSRQPNTTATWRRPNDKHWCNVCKIFVDGNPNKIRQHEASGRHQNNMRQQMKALRRRELDQKRLQQEKEAEIRAIEQAAVAALHGDTQAGFVRSSALAAAGNYLYEPVARVSAPARVGPQAYRGLQSEQVKLPPATDDDDRFPEHQFFSAEPPPPVIVDYVKRANVEVDEATGMGVWESVPVEEQTQEIEEEQEEEEQPGDALPNPEMVPAAFADIDEFTEREQIAELENDYGLPAIRKQAQQKPKTEAHETVVTDDKDTKPSLDQKVQFSFKKRRKTKHAGQ